MEEKISKYVFTFCIFILITMCIYTLYSMISMGIYNASIPGNIILVAILDGIGVSYYKEKRLVCASLFFVASIIPLASTIGSFLI